MRVAPLADVKARLSAYLEQVERDGPIVITRNGRAAAVLVAPANDDDLERLLLAYSPRFQALLNKSRQSIKQGKGLAHLEFWKAVEERYDKESRPRSSSQRSRSGRRSKRSPSVSSVSP